MKKLNITTSTLIGFSIASSFGDGITRFTPEEVNEMGIYIKDNTMNDLALTQYLLGCVNKKYAETYQDYQKELGSDIVKTFHQFKCLYEVSKNVEKHYEEVKGEVDRQKADYLTAAKLRKTLAIQIVIAPQKDCQKSLNAINLYKNACITEQNRENSYMQISKTCNNLWEARGRIASLMYANIESLKKIFAPKNSQRSIAIWLL